ncbi:MAG: vanadium-dependent haloperoxidase [Saprospiraceae bacterium]|nr:vanadium-dependent haloperoxidase [Saprospiraceae bacterium]
MRYIIYVILGWFLLTFQACKEDLATPFILNQASDYPADVALQWVTLQRELVKTTPGFTPPVAARAYGYAALALYESVVPGIKENVSYAGLIQNFNASGLPAVEANQQYDWGLSANAAMAYMMKNLFKTTSAANQLAIDQLEQSFIAQSSETDQTIIDRSVDFGKKVAEAVYNYSKTDNQDEAYLNNFPDYTVPDIPGKWEPTAPNQKPLQPYWGDVRTFVSSNASDNLLIQPTTYSTDPKSVFYLEANEVYIAVLNVTAEQSDIAKFWSDDPGITSTPPGHSMSIATIVLQNENADLAMAAEVFSKVGMAVHDAFVSCWKCKYAYNLVRPVTYIKKFIDPQFATILPTPPFPEHTSGHSVQTGAAMTVLEHYFGYHYTITDNTHVSRNDINGSPRTFSSFADLAEETAISRLYGGIHYRPAIAQGVKQGRVIGRNVALIDLKK